NTQVVFNLTNPDDFVKGPAASKATFWIDPGRRLYFNLRVWGLETLTKAFDPGTVQVQVQAQAVGTAAAAGGQTTPPVISSLGITTTSVPTGVAANNYAALAGSTLTAAGGTPPYAWS